MKQKKASFSNKHLPKYTGHPVLGDEKYGKGKDKYKRLALHAKSISFIHPASGKRLTFETGVPEYFNKLVEEAVKVSGKNMKERGQGFGQVI
jgi:hypothetical protein